MAIPRKCVLCDKPCTDSYTFCNECVTPLGVTEQLATKDAEIERLKGERDHHEEYAKSAKRESTFWWNKSEWGRWQLYTSGLAHEKREAALLAFVAADDAVALHNNQELIACSEFASGVAWHRELSQLENTKDEAREQLRRVIDGMD